MKEIHKYFTGDLIQVIEAKDQSKYEAAPNIGKIGLVVRNIPFEEGMYSKNMYYVLVDERFIKLHSLDMQLLSGVDRNEI